MLLDIIGTNKILSTDLFSLVELTQFPHFEFTQTQLIILDIGISQVLNSTAENEGERDENKTGAYISLYTVALVNKKTLFLDKDHEAVLGLKRVYY